MILQFKMLLLLLAATQPIQRRPVVVNINPSGTLEAVTLKNGKAFTQRLGGIEGFQADPRYPEFIVAAVDPCRGNLAIAICLASSKSSIYVWTDWHFGVPGRPVCQTPTIRMSWESDGGLRLFKYRGGADVFVDSYWPSSDGWVSRTLNLQFQSKYSDYMATAQILEPKADTLGVGPYPRAEQGGNDDTLAHLVQSVTGSSLTGRSLFAIQSSESRGIYFLYDGTTKLATIQLPGNEQPGGIEFLDSDSLAILCRDTGGRSRIRIWSVSESGWRASIPANILPSYDVEASPLPKTLAN